MGYHVHHAIAVTSWSAASITEAHRLALEVFAGTSLVSPLCDGVINGFASFFVAPDGSKEGWPESDEMDARRATFIIALRNISRSYVGLDWVEVAFGGDEPLANTRVLDHDGLD